MDVETFEFTKNSGWNVSEFPSLDSDRTLVSVFGGRNYLDDDEPLRELADAFPNSVVVGCSSAGEISENRIGDETLSVAVTKFDNGNVRSAVTTIGAMDESRAAGHQLAEELDGEDLAAVLVFSQGVDVNGTDLVEGINEELGSSIPVTGGLAGDGDRFEETWVFDGDEVRNDIIVAVGLYGDDLRVSHGSRGGWDEFGPERAITKADGNVLYELDGKPALERYKRYLGDRAGDLPASALLFPLEIQPQERPDEKLVRTILDVDEEEQSMIFAGDMPEGAKARFMKVNLDQLVDAASRAAEETANAEDHGDEEPVLGIAVSCVGRRLVLEDRTERELEAVLDELPDSTELVGFYSYGELSPVEQGDDCALHNQTMTLTAISEG